jgi:hypothetical protein
MRVPRQGRTAHRPLHQRPSHFESQARVEPLHLRGLPGRTRGSFMLEPFSEVEKIGDVPDPLPNRESVAINPDGHYRGLPPGAVPPGRDSPCVGLPGSRVCPALRERWVAPSNAPVTGKSFEC